MNILLFATTFYMYDAVSSLLVIYDYHSAQYDTRRAEHLKC